MQTIDDFLPPQTNHDQFVLDLINTSAKRIEQHYQQFANELAINTDVYDVQPQLAFQLDGHQLNIQYTPFRDYDERQASTKLVRFDGQACDVQLYLEHSALRKQKASQYFYTVLNTKTSREPRFHLYPQTFSHYQDAVNFAKQQSKAHAQHYKHAEITILHKSNGQPSAFLIRNDHHQLDQWAWNRIIN